MLAPKPTLEAQTTSGPQTCPARPGTLQARLQGRGGNFAAISTETPHGAAGEPTPAHKRELAQDEQMTTTTTNEYNGLVAVNGTVVRDEGVVGVEGLLEVIGEAVDALGWADAMTTVQIVSRTGPDGKRQFHAYNITTVEDEAEGNFPVLVEDSPS